MLSATVIAPSSMVADAYATAIMVKGRKYAAELAHRHPEIAYYLIYSLPDGTITTEYSASFEPFLLPYRTGIRLTDTALPHLQDAQRCPLGGDALWAHTEEKQA